MSTPCQRRRRLSSRRHKRVVATSCRPEHPPEFAAQDIAHRPPPFKRDDFLLFAYIVNAIRVVRQERAKHPPRGAAGGYVAWALVLSLGSSLALASGPDLGDRLVSLLKLLRMF